MFIRYILVYSSERVLLLFYFDSIWFHLFSLGKSEISFVLDKVCLLHTYLNSALKIQCHVFKSTLLQTAFSAILPSGYISRFLFKAYYSTSFASNTLVVIILNLPNIFCRQTIFTFFLLPTNSFYRRQKVTRKFLICKIQSVKKLLNSDDQNLLPINNFSNILRI